MLVQQGRLEEADDRRGWRSPIRRRGPWPIRCSAPSGFSSSGSTRAQAFSGGDSAGARDLLGRASQPRSSVLRASGTSGTLGDWNRSDGSSSSTPPTGRHRRTVSCQAAVRLPVRRCCLSKDGIRLLKPSTSSKRARQTGPPSYELAFNLGSVYLLNAIPRARSTPTTRRCASSRTPFPRCVRPPASRSSRASSNDRCPTGCARGSSTPDDPEMLLGFGRVCLKMDLLDDAEPALTEAAALKPDEPSYQYTLAAAKVGKRQFEAAQALLEALVAKRPADPQLQYALGSVLYIQGRLRRGSGASAGKRAPAAGAARLASLSRAGRPRPGARRARPSTMLEALLRTLSRSRALVRSAGRTADERAAIPRGGAPPAQSGATRAAVGESQLPARVCSSRAWARRRRPTSSSRSRRRCGRKTKPPRACSCDCWSQIDDAASGSVARCSCCRLRGGECRRAREARQRLRASVSELRRPSSAIPPIPSCMSRWAWPTGTATTTRVR